MFSFIIAVCIYSFSLSITPGPSNIIMMSTGLNSGFRSTLPFAVGCVFGFLVMFVLIALGLGSVVVEGGQFMQILNYFGAAFIVYMGYKIATSRDKIDKENEEGKKHPGFVFGTLFQVINAKSWIACVAGIGAFNLISFDERMVMFIIFDALVAFPCMLLWGFGGAKIRRFLHTERNLIIFNYIMGASLVLVAIYLLMESFK